MARRFQRRRTRRADHTVSCAHDKRGNGRLPAGALADRWLDAASALASAAPQLNPPPRRWSRRPATAPSGCRAAWRRLALQRRARGRRCRRDARTPGPLDRRQRHPQRLGSWKGKAFALRQRRIATVPWTHNGRRGIHAIGFSCHTLPGICIAEFVIRSYRHVRNINDDYWKNVLLVEREWLGDEVAQPVRPGVRLIVPRSRRGSFGSSSRKSMLGR